MKDEGPVCGFISSKNCSLVTISTLGWEYQWCDCRACVVNQTHNELCWVFLQLL